MKTVNDWQIDAQNQVNEQLCDYQSHKLLKRIFRQSLAPSWNSGSSVWVRWSGCYVNCDIWRAFFGCRWGSSLISTAIVQWGKQLKKGHYLFQSQCQRWLLSKMRERTPNIFSFESNASPTATYLIWRQYTSYMTSRHAFIINSKLDHEIAHCALTSTLDLRPLLDGQ